MARTTLALLFISLLTLSALHAASAAYDTKAVLPSSSAYGCFGLNNAITLVNSAVTSLAGASSTTKTVINGVLTPLLGIAAISNVSSYVTARGCVGNWYGEDILSDISECENMLIGDTSQFSVIALTLPVFPGMCGATALGEATLCVAMGLYNNLPTVSFQANDGTLSCISTLAGGAVGYALGTALSLGLSGASVGISLSGSLEDTATLFTGSVTQSVTITGNYYDYVGISIPTDNLKIPNIISLTGNAYRTINIIDNANTWANSLSSVKSASDLAKLFTSYRILMRADITFSVSLKSVTGGVLPDIGPITLGQAAMLMATVSTAQTAETALPGFYLYVSAGATNIIATAVTSITQALITQLEGPIDDLFSVAGINFNSGKVVQAISSALKGDSTSNTAFGFAVNSETIGVTIQIPITALSLTGNKAAVFTVTCSVKYSSSKFSCKVNLNPGLTDAFFSAILDNGVWVIKKAAKFFDETGTTIAFAAKELGTFSKKALQTTAEGIQKGTYKLVSYSNDAANWAKEAIYECGFQTIASATLCGTQAVTDGTICGMDFITDGAKCGYDWVTSAAICGYKSVTDAAICGTETVWNCVKSLFKWKSCKKPKSCKTIASCSTPKSCGIPKSCDIALSCKVANSC